MNVNGNGLMADNGYSYPSDAQLRNIFASSCVEAAARSMQVPAVEMYRRRDCHGGCVRSPESEREQTKGGEGMRVYPIISDMLCLATYFYGTK